ncbi:MAG: hypothetical protein ACRC5C_14895 [Bacilli bacterium]
MRRILQGRWGLKIDKKESIEDFFDDKFMPSANWEGWHANVNLDDIKIKVMQSKGLSPTKAGYWEKEQERAAQSGANPIPMHNVLSELFSESRLKEALIGAGLSSVDVEIKRTFGKTPSINTNINIVKDVRQEFINEINRGVVF